MDIRQAFPQAIISNTRPTAAPTIAGQVVIQRGLGTDPDPYGRLVLWSYDLPGQSGWSGIAISALTGSGSPSFNGLESDCRGQLYYDMNNDNGKCYIATSNTPGSDDWEEQGAYVGS